MLIYIMKGKKGYILWEVSERIWEEKKRENRKYLSAL